MSPAKVRCQLPNLRNTPSSSRTSYTVEDSDESDDVLSGRKGGKMFEVKGEVVAKGKSPRKKGSVVKKRDGKLPFKALPTPVKSSQPAAKGNEVFGMFIFYLMGELRPMELVSLFIPTIRSRLAPVISYTLTDMKSCTDRVESDEDELETNNIRPDHRGSTRKSTNTIGSSSSRARCTKPAVSYVDDSDGSPPEDEFETPSNMNKGRGKEKAFSLSPSRGRENDEVTELPQKSPRVTRASESASNPLKKAKDQREKSVTLSSDSDDMLAFLVPRNSKRRKVNKPVKQEPLAVDDKDSDELQPGSSILRRGRKLTVPDDDYSDADGPLVSKLMTYSKSPQNGKSRSQAIDLGDDSDDEPIKSSLPPRKPRVSIPVDEDEDSEPITSPLMDRKRRNPVVDSDESDRASSPQKRRRQVNDEDEDEDSDLPALHNISSKNKGRARSGSSTSTPTPTRVTRQAKSRRHRTVKEKQMELLRRKRAGEDIDELTDSTEASDEPRKGIYDSDSDLEMLSNFEDESEPEEQAAQPRKKKLNKAVNNDSYQLSEDSDFVVEDDEGLIGVPHLGLMDIPLQFRHAAHKPMKEHFKDAIEWMVHRKINPAFPRNDEIYLQSFRKLDDEYQGYAKSKFVSTQWTAEFTKAIYARPIFIERGCAEGEGYTLDGVPKCDVCNHRKHYPKFMIHFEGKAYHKSTLEEVEGDSEDEDDEDDAQSVNSKGQSLPPEDKEWSSGK